MMARVSVERAGGILRSGRAASAVMAWTVLACAALAASGCSGPVVKGRVTLGRISVATVVPRGDEPVGDRPVANARVVIRGELPTGAARIYETRTRGDGEFTARLKGLTERERIEIVADAPDAVRSRWSGTIPDRGNYVLMVMQPRVAAPAAR